LRVLVIGGTRFIGPRVVKQLVEKGHDVAVFNRGETGAELPEGAGRVRGERRNLANFAGEFRRLAPDVVLDMIPMNEKEARGVVHVFEGIAQRIVAVSSGDVYRAYDRLTGRDPGPPDPVPLHEHSPLREMLYPYEGRGDDEYEKILVEKVVKGESGLPGTVLRLPAVYGPGDYQHRLFPYLKRMDDGRPAILLSEGISSWRWTLGYVEDVAAAIVLVTVDGRAAGRTYNVGESDPLPWAERVREIGRAAGWSGEIVAVSRRRLPEHLDQGLDTDQHLFVDTSRIRRELGYEEAVSRSEALRDTVVWERRHPPAEVDFAYFDYAAEDAVLAGLDR
jgi:nucleoside-diphosphate-sugar epimerase